MSPKIGVVGGGQLSRMLAEAASPLGISIRVLAAAGEEGAEEIVPLVSEGAATDPVALRNLAEAVDVITIDHENVGIATLQELEDEGFAVFPSARTIAFADKAHQRREFTKAGLPVPDHIILDGAQDDLKRACEFSDRHGGQLVLKASTGGYDGRGVWMLNTGQLSDFLTEYSGAPLVVEPRLPLDAEFAVLVARTQSGDISTWPVVETVQIRGMCRTVKLPSGLAPDLESEARQIGERVAEAVDSVGVMAVELFLVGGDLVINEIAPRVHNSGHITMESSATSQFEQHLRAILGWSLGPADSSAAAGMVNVVGGVDVDPRDRQSAALAAVPEAHIHLYGKSSRPERKLGHVTVTGDDLSTCVQRAEEAAAELERST